MISILSALNGVTTVDETEKKVKMGFVGGMGPQAGVALAKWFTAFTDAQHDQEHFEFVLVSKPSTPDRTEFLKGIGPDPAPSIIEAVKELEAVGCTHYAIGCNTAHAPRIIDRVLPTTSMQNVSIVDSAMYALHEMALMPGAKVGLMSTEGTIIAGAYQAALTRAGYECVLPSGDNTAVNQKSVNEGIRAVKAGDMALGNVHFAKVAEDLRGMGAKALLLACTEIPLAYSSQDSIDTTAALAKACVRICRGK